MCGHFASDGLAWGSTGDCCFVIFSRSSKNWLFSKTTFFDEKQHTKIINRKDKVVPYERSGENPRPESCIRSFCTFFPEPDRPKLYLKNNFKGILPKKPKSRPSIPEPWMSWWWLRSKGPGPGKHKENPRPEPLPGKMMSKSLITRGREMQQWILHRGA